MRIGPVAAALTMAAALACSGGSEAPTDPGLANIAALARKQGVVARVDGGVLLLRNTTSYGVSVGVVESTYFERALRMWCFGYDPCGTLIPPGKTLRIPFGEIPGYHRGAVSAEVFWWRAGVNPNSDQLVHVHQFQVRLHRR